MKRSWPLFLSLVRWTLHHKGFTPTNPRVIDIIGEGWRAGLSALTVANNIIAYELDADEEARNAAHDG